VTANSFWRRCVALFPKLGPPRGVGVKPTQNVYFEIGPPASGGLVLLIFGLEALSPDSATTGRKQGSEADRRFPLRK